MNLYIIVEEIKMSNSPTESEIVNDFSENCYNCNDDEIQEHINKTNAFAH